MSWIADVVTTAFSGGITGLVGAVFQGFLHLKENSDKRKFDLEMRRLDINELVKEGEIALKQTQAEAESRRIVGELNAFASSQKADKATYSNKRSSNPWLVAVDVLRGLIRPVLTIGLVCITVVITIDVVEASGGYENLITQHGTSLASELILSIVYMSSTAVLWWFGTRANNQAIKKHN